MAKTRNAAAEPDPEDEPDPTGEGTAPLDPGASWEDLFAGMSPADLARLAETGSLHVETPEELPYPLDTLDEILRSLPRHPSEELGEAAQRIMQEREEQIAAVMRGATFPDLGQEETVPEPDPSLTAADVARWMQQRIEAEGILYHGDAVQHITHYFGIRFLSDNRHGNPRLVDDVLDEFRALNERTVVWHRRERYWRPRRPGDPPGRMIG